MPSHLTKRKAHTLNQICQAYLDQTFAATDRDLTRDVYEHFFTPNLLTMTIVLLGQIQHLRMPETTQTVCEKIRAITSHSLAFIRQDAWPARGTEFDGMWGVVEGIWKAESLLRRHERKRVSRLHRAHLRAATPSLMISQTAEWKLQTEIPHSPGLGLSLIGMTFNGS